MHPTWIPIGCLSVRKWIRQTSFSQLDYKIPADLARASILLASWNPYGLAILGKEFA